MASHELLRDLGLFDARAPRYTSYPPANHFPGGVGPDQVSTRLQEIPAGTHISV